MPNPKIPFAENGDPYLKWLFNEIDVQGIRYDDLCRRAGVARGLLYNIKTRNNTRFQTFRCLVEALGYEITLTAKEPKENGRSLSRLETPTLE